ncbi:unnamed protein product, partial [Lampetra planeri]
MDLARDTPPSSSKPPPPFHQLGLVHVSPPTHLPTLFISTPRHPYTDPPPLVPRSLIAPSTHQHLLPRQHLFVCAPSMPRAHTARPARESHSCFPDGVDAPVRSPHRGKETTTTPHRILVNHRGATELTGQAVPSPRDVGHPRQRGLESTPRPAHAATPDTSHETVGKPPPPQLLLPHTPSTRQLVELRPRGGRPRRHAGDVHHVRRHVADVRRRRGGQRVHARGHVPVDALVRLHVRVHREPGAGRSALPLLHPVRGVHELRQRLVLRRPGLPLVVQPRPAHDAREHLHPGRDEHGALRGGGAPPRHGPPLAQISQGAGARRVGRLAAARTAHDHHDGAVQSVQDQRRGALPVRALLAHELPQDLPDRAVRHQHPGAGPHHRLAVRAARAHLLALPDLRHGHQGHQTLAQPEGALPHLQHRARLLGLLPAVLDLAAGECLPPGRGPMERGVCQIHEPRGHVPHLQQQLHQPVPLHAAHQELPGVSAQQARTCRSHRRRRRGLGRDRRRLGGRPRVRGPGIGATALAVGAYARRLAALHLVRQPTLHRDHDGHGAARAPRAGRV